MDKNIEKSEFLCKVEDFANKMSEMTSENKDAKRGLIILATEAVEGKNGTNQIIGVCGNAGSLAEVIAEFASQDATKELFMHGAKLATLKTLAKHLAGGGIKVNLFINK